MASDDDRVKWYRKILQEDPASRIFVDLAEVLYSQGHWQDVIEVCRQGLDVHPGINRARVLCGLALWRMDELEASERKLEAVRQEQERNTPLYKTLGMIAWKKGQPGRACRLMDIYLTLKPTDSDARMTRRKWDQEIRRPPAAVPAAPELEEAEPIPEAPSPPEQPPVELSAPSMALEEEVEPSEEPLELPQETEIAATARAEQELLHVSEPEMPPEAMDPLQSESEPQSVGPASPTMIVVDTEAEIEEPIGHKLPPEAMIDKATEPTLQSEPEPPASDEVEEPEQQRIGFADVLSLWAQEIRARPPKTSDHVSLFDDQDRLILKQLLSTGT